MNSFAQWLIEQRWKLFTLMLIVSIFPAFFLGNLGLDNSLAVWFLEDDPTLLQYNAFKSLYGNDEIILIRLEPQSGSLFDKQFVTQLSQACKKIKQNPLVRRVLSLTEAPYVKGTSDGRLLIEDMGGNEKNILYGERLKKRLYSNPLWPRLLLNKANTACYVIVEPVVSKDMDQLRPKLIAYIKKSFAPFSAQYAGMGIVYEELNRISLRDSPLFTSISYLLLIGLLVLFFRSGRLLLACSITIAVSLIIFLGMAGFFHFKFNMISAILPSLILILSLSDLVHIFSRYSKTPPGTNRLKDTLNHTLLPCFLTSLTTAFGFFSLISSPMRVLKNFGQYAAFGVMLEYIVAIIVSVIILARLQKHVLIKAETGDDASDHSLVNDWLDNVLTRISTLVHTHPKMILVMGVLCIGLGVWGIIFLKADTYSLGFLPANNGVRRASDFIEKDYGYYVPLELRLRPIKADSVKDPAFLQAVNTFHAQLEQMTGTQKPTSLVDVVKHLNRELTDGTDASYRIPSSVEATAQELLLYEMDDDNDLEFFVTPDYKELRLTVRIPMVSSSRMAAIKKRVSDLFQSTMAGKATLTYGGYIPLYVKMMDYILSSQIRSFLIAFLIIFCVLGVIFRSGFLLIAAIVPNIIPIALCLGTMGWLKIPLDIATVTIAAIAIGISVDDTIHFIYTYGARRRQGMPVKEAVHYTILTAGKAIIITSMLLIIGYLVFLFAEIKSVIFFGLLIALTMFFALVCDLVLLPAFLILFDRRIISRADLS